jgi:hypothetical protein
MLAEHRGIADAHHVQVAITSTRWPIAAGCTRFAGVSRTQWSRGRTRLLCQLIDPTSIGGSGPIAAVRSDLSSADAHQAARLRALARTSHPANCSLKSRGR